MEAARHSAQNFLEQLYRNQHEVSAAGQSASVQHASPTYSPHETIGVWYNRTSTGG